MTLSALLVTVVDLSAPRLQDVQVQIVAVIPNEGSSDVCVRILAAVAFNAFSENGGLHGPLRAPDQMN